MIMANMLKIVQNYFGRQPPLPQPQALVSSQKYARYVPKIPQGRTHSYYPCHFNRYFPCQNVDRTQIDY